MLIRLSISSPSKYVILITTFDMIFLIIKGLDHLGVEKIHFCIVYKTNAAEN